MADPDSLQPGDPEWMRIAFEELDAGVYRYLAPGQSNPRIEKYQATTTLGVTPVGDETDWCASFVNYCIVESHNEGTNSARARDWLDWGTPTNNPVRGCVVVFKRSQGKGHVAFYLGHTSRTIRVLGGNQTHRVSIADQKASDWLGYRLGPVEEDDFMALFDNVNEFKAAVRAVVKDELRDTYAALARGEIDGTINPTSQHFKDSNRGVGKAVADQLHDTYAALARGEIDDRIDPTSQHFKDSHRHLAELLEAIATATNAQLPQPNPNP
jgi:uncharacterized protein (TIGR02594 family)